VNLKKTTVAWPVFMAALCSFLPISLIQQQEIS